MTQIDEEATQQNSIILVFDICGSSIIIEDLTTADNLSVVRDMFIKLRDWLKAEQNKYSFEICNFTGDGWILLFPFSTSGTDLQSFMLGLSNEYYRIMKTFVIKRMEHRPKIIEIFFGAASGRVVKFKMFNRTEYVGRPINIACRLQGKIRSSDTEEIDTTNYKLCVPSSLYFDKFVEVPGMFGKKKELSLHNIAGERSIQCVLLRLVGPRPPDASRPKLRPFL